MDNFLKTLAQTILNTLEEHETSLRKEVADLQEKLLIVDLSCLQLEAQLEEAKLNAQSIIAEAETEAKGIVAVEINQARTDAASLIELTDKELGAQKKLALQKLETQIDELSQLIIFLTQIVDVTFKPDIFEAKVVNLIILVGALVFLRMKCKEKLIGRQAAL